MSSARGEPTALAAGTAIMLPAEGPHVGQGVVERMATRCRLALQPDRELAVLHREDDAELHVGHSVALDPVIEPPALIGAEFPTCVEVAEEPEDVDLAIAADPDVADEPGLLLAR